MGGGGHGGLAPNGCMIVRNNNITVSGEAILSAEYSGNLWAVVALPRIPLEELTALPRPPGEEGACCPQAPHPALGLRPFDLYCVLSSALHDISCTRIARYCLFVLKVSLNTNQPTNRQRVCRCIIMPRWSNGMSLLGTFQVLPPSATSNGHIVLILITQLTSKRIIPVQ